MAWGGGVQNRKTRTTAEITEIFYLTVEHGKGGDNFFVMISYSFLLGGGCLSKAEGGHRKGG